jgi:hypothetical protein
MNEIEGTQSGDMSAADISRIMEEQENLFRQRDQRLAARVDPSGTIAEYDPALVKLMGLIMGTKALGSGNEDDLALELGKLLIARLRKAPTDSVDTAERTLKDLSAMRKKAFAEEIHTKRIAVAMNLMAEYRRTFGDPALDRYAFALWLWQVTQKVEKGLFPDPTNPSSWTKIYKSLGLRK